MKYGDKPQYVLVMICLQVLRVQWNPSKTDTFGTKKVVRYKGVSFTDGLFKPIEI